MLKIMITLRQKTQFNNYVIYFQISVNFQSVFIMIKIIVVINIIFFFCFAFFSLKWLGDITCQSIFISVFQGVSFIIAYKKMLVQPNCRPSIFIHGAINYSFHDDIYLSCNLLRKVLLPSYIPFTYSILPCTSLHTMHNISFQKNFGSYLRPFEHTR